MGRSGRYESYPVLSIIREDMRVAKPVKGFHRLFKGEVKVVVVGAATGNDSLAAEGRLRADRRGTRNGVFGPFSFAMGCRADEGRSGGGEPRPTPWRNASGTAICCSLALSGCGLPR